MCEIGWCVSFVGGLEDSWATGGFGVSCLGRREELGRVGVSVGMELGSIDVGKWVFATVRESGKGGFFYMCFW